MSNSSPDDKALAAQAAAGRESAFRELLQRYERPVFSLIYRMVRDRGLAEDLSQVEGSARKTASVANIPAASQPVGG